MFAAKRKLLIEARLAVVKGCRTPVVAGRVPRTRSAGVGQASGEETAGGLGSAVRGVWSMGILRRQGVCRSLRDLLDREDPVGRETDGPGVATALRWRWRVLQVELGARGGLEPSGTVAGVGGRHASRFSAG